MFAVAFAAGTLSIFFTVSDAGLFVALVPGARYVGGNSLIYQSRALAGVAGPSVGGLLGMEPGETVIPLRPAEPGRP